MKKVPFLNPFPDLLFLLLLVSLTQFCNAQNARKHDLIIKRDSVKIEALIQQVDESIVKYKKRSDPDGPVFSVAKKEIASIIYGNGEIENFPAPTDQYFDEISVPPVATYQNPETPAKIYSGAEGQIRSRTTEQLKSNYQLYVKKAATYKSMSIIGSSVGILLTVIGIVTIAEATPSYNMYGVSTNSYDAKLAGGTLLMMAGLGAGIPLTIIGLVKKKNYNKKAIVVKDELRRRNALSFQPGYQFANQAGYLSLRMSF